jgi:hypothetical protein
LYDGDSDEGARTQWIRHCGRLLDGLWEFHGGARMNVRFSDRTKPFMLGRAAWHELTMTVAGADFKAWLDGAMAIEYTLGSEPAAGRRSYVVGPQP